MRLSATDTSKKRKRDCVCWSVRLGGLPSAPSPAVSPSGCVGGSTGVNGVVPSGSRRCDVGDVSGDGSTPLPLLVNDAPFAPLPSDETLPRDGNSKNGREDDAFNPRSWPSLGSDDKEPTLGNDRTLRLRLECRRGGRLALRRGAYPGDKAAAEPGERARRLLLDGRGGRFNLSSLMAALQLNTTHSACRLCVGVRGSGGACVSGDHYIRDAMTQRTAVCWLTSVAKLLNPVKRWSCSSCSDAHQTRCVSTQSEFD